MDSIFLISQAFYGDQTIVPYFKIDRLREMYKMFKHAIL